MKSALLKYLPLWLSLLLLILNISCDSGNTPQHHSNAKKDSLVYLNHADTAKYVGMQVCRNCHQEIYNSFIKTGMGQSIDIASMQKSAAVFSKSSFYDAASGYNYKAYWEKEQLFFKEWKNKGADTTYRRVEKADYIIGSGQHTNSHLQLVNGYLFQMPMTFYTQKGEWHLPPGFENNHNSRFSRKIGLECMSCHNSFPDFVLGSENKYKAVPNGIGCERCHGPGSIHVQQRSTGSRIDTSRYIDYSIVNPAKLPIDLQFDICQRCHLQGNAVLKEGKSFLDFKPGQKLSDYFSVFLPKYKHAEDEFIMASHADRLKQSACFIKSLKKNEQQAANNLRPYKSALTCVTCHNPHLSVKATKLTHFNNTCRSCHGVSVESICTEKSVSKPGAFSSANCVSCHMPNSGSTDIPHVTVHDHYIRKPLNKKEKAQIKEFLGLYAINETKPDSLTKALAYINQYEKFELKAFYLDSAQKYISLNSLANIKKNLHAWVQLYFLKGQYQQVVQLAGRCGTEELLQSYLTKKSYNNQHAWTCYRIAEAYTSTGDITSALKFLSRAYQLAPYTPEFMDKLAGAYADAGKYTEARKYYEMALQEQARYVPAITNLGYLCLLEGKLTEAEHWYKKGLQLDPDDEALLLNLAGLYNYQQDFAASKKILQQILKRNPAHSQAKLILQQLGGK